MSLTILTLFASKCMLANHPKEPFWADFGDCDTDGSPRLGNVFYSMNLEKLDYIPDEGEQVWLSDGEVEMRGILKCRNGIWIAIPDKNGFQDVPKEAPYHNDNLHFPKDI